MIRTLIVCTSLLVALPASAEELTITITVASQPPLTVTRTIDDRSASRMFEEIGAGCAIPVKPSPDNMRPAPKPCSQTDVMLRWIDRAIGDSSERVRARDRSKIDVSSEIKGK